MPWCERCDRYLTPTSMEADGTCPTCHGEVDTDAMDREAERREETAEEPTRTKIPWHFWLLLTAAVIYLGWRAIEGVVWLVGLL